MKKGFEKICPNCFSDKMAGDICGSCGFDRKSARKNSLAIEQFGILNERYLLGRIIGAGGFGITYLAYDTKMNQICAVKEFVPLGLVERESDGQMLQAVSEDKEKFYAHGKKRFFEEAQALYQCAKIPDVVRITDYFKANGTVYFVMEYIKGITLKKYAAAKGGKLPVETCLEIIYKTGIALDRVHRETGLFHRDISPENIMLTVENKVKIIDFGSAKNISNKGEALSVVLKPGFAPPEQYSSNSPQGPYTDVYALAGTFYYIVSGTMLPVAPERLTGSDYTRLKDMNLGVNAHISDTVDQALKLSYKERTQSVAEFVSELYPTTVSPGGIGIEPGDIPGVGNRGIREPQKEDVTERKEPYHGRIPYIEVLQGVMSGCRWNLPCSSEVKVGRSPNWSNIVIQGSQQISKLHFILEYDTGQDVFFIEDRSVNGVYVQNIQLESKKRYMIEKNSMIMLGAYVCILKLGVDYD